MWHRLAATALFPKKRFSVFVSRIARHLASPKKALTTAAVAAATAGMVLAAAPAEAASTSSASSAKAIAQKLIPNDAQYNAFSKIVEHESGWNVGATNASSGAYGLVQALPGSKMASAGSDWKTSAATQIEWGLKYMNERYGSPVGAWNFWQTHHWY
ncbi:transglycosylase-like domain protein [Streptomyces turgidiscabies Car8]|uniref:Transglycosylase-like domain protein n=1 Tax=Streptomyces turgidiscabies (strain Car8) TaxID=698760 RepID=L7EZG1_STRT8|nr:transglycosylase-like domain protein [Streptomyces turgidiscabies Car8]GAQ68339.1 transglycosylase SLT domain protein [Streptomyces turgidiscabies]